MIWKATLVFVALFALDFVYARYTSAISENIAVRAGVYAGVIILLSGFAQIVYINDPWLLAPAVIGAFVGTWTAVRYR